MDGLFQLIQMLILPGFVLGALLLILGSPVAGRAIILVVVLALLLPIIWEILPPWVTLTFIALISLVFLQAILSIIMGRKIAENVVSGLVTDLFRVIIRVIVLPIHFIRRIINMAIDR